MRRGWAIAAAILVVLLTTGIAVGAYNAGLDEGTRRAADPDQVVQVVSGYGHGYGFFPFGFFLFPLLIIGTIFLVSRAFRGPRGPWGHDHGPGHGREYGPWSDEGRTRFEERAGDWHRRQHEQATGEQESTGPPTG